jgi:hypothetical protein
VNKPFTRLAVVVFALVALAHLLRLVYGWEVTFDGAAIPLWPSVAGLIIAGGLAAGLWQESRK